VAPRRKVPELPYEAAVVQRVTAERERRGMSREAMAQALTDAGCPLAAGAVVRLESGRRRVTLNETIAYSVVLDLPLVELVNLSPGLDSHIRELRAEARRLQAEAERLDAQRQATLAQLDDVREKVVQAVGVVVASAEASARGIRNGKP
jgi:transcriptional regulator with XRE-family HTH domain